MAIKTDKLSFHNLFHLITVLFLTLMLGKVSESSLCRAVVEDAEEKVVTNGNYSCPRSADPKPHTECCPGAGGCCPRARYFYEIDPTLANIIVLSVTSFCIVFAIVIAVCCFWSGCFLYSACRAEFTHDIATYESKEDSIELDTMPTEFSIKSMNKFSPVVVSNGNLPLDADTL